MDCLNLEDKEVAMAQKKKATEAAPTKHHKDSDIQRNKKEINERNPQRIGKVMQEAERMNICRRSGEVSLMAIIAKHRKCQ